MFKVYGKEDCPYCVLALSALKERRLEYIYTDVTKDAEALAMLKESGFRTVPQIWDDGVHVGGYENLITHLSKKDRVAP